MQSFGQMNFWRMLALLGVGLIVLGMDCGETEPETFVNFENHPVHGLDLTPDGTRLLVSNTPDGQLEVFDLTGSLPVHVANVPVGLDPVSVRARTNDEVWVVNHVSDSVSVVSLSAGNVVATLITGNEPADVVFAGTPQRAFVSLSAENRLAIYDPADLSAAPTFTDIAGEDPRALETDGTRVYAAIFESGNATTAIPFGIVSDVTGPYGGFNPPFNDLGAPTGFTPEKNAANPTAPITALILRKNALGEWRDIAGQDWSAMFGWDVLDHDLAIIDAANPSSVSYVDRLMTLDMALTRMHDGRIAIVGTESTNEVRFEPNLTGTFVRVQMATVNPTTLASTVVDLNPHLDYSTSTVPAGQRDQSVGDPRAVAWSSTQDLGWVAGLGSNNIIMINAAGPALGNDRSRRRPGGLGAG